MPFYFFGVSYLRTLTQVCFPLVLLLFFVPVQYIVKIMLSEISQVMKDKYDLTCKCNLINKTNK